jgi:hypothetical protein
MEALKSRSTSPLVEPISLGEPMLTPSKEKSRSAEIVTKVAKEAITANVNDESEIADLLLALDETKVVTQTVFASKCPQTPNRNYTQEKRGGLWYSVSKKTEMTDSRDGERPSKKTK